MALQILCYQSADSFEKLQGIWQALERRDMQCTPFNTWHWNRLWWTHYASNSDRLCLLLAMHDNRVVAIAPLYLHQTRMLRALPTRVLRFIGSGGDTSPDYLNFIAEPQFRDRAENALFAHIRNLPDWHKLYLSDVRSDSTLAIRIARFVDCFQGVALPTQTNVIQRADLPQSFDDYRANLSRKRRKQINHRQNRLDAAGHCELNLCSTLDEVLQATNALVTLHRLRWQSKGEPGAFSSQAYERFHRAVIQQFFANDALWLATLKLDNDIIGVQYIFLWRGELLFMQSGYSPAAQGLSPGHVLFTYVIRRAIEQGIVAIDMLKGGYDYKSIYARDTRELINQGVVRSGIRAFAQRHVNRLRG